MTLGVKVVSMGDGEPIAYVTGALAQIAFFLILPVQTRFCFIFSLEADWSKTRWLNDFV